MAVAVECMCPAAIRQTGVCGEQAGKRKVHSICVFRDVLPIGEAGSGVVSGLSGDQVGPVRRAVDTGDADVRRREVEFVHCSGCAFAASGPGVASLR